MGGDHHVVARHERPGSIPPDAAATFAGAGLEIDYLIRVLIDRRFQPDMAIERPVAVV